MTNLILRDQTTGAKAQNVAWFAQPFTPPISAGKASNIKLHINAQSSVVVEVTYDGVNWAALNNGAAVGIGISTWDLFLISVDVFNVRTPDVAGVTLNTARLILDQDA